MQQNSDCGMQMLHPCQHFDCAIVPRTNRTKASMPEQCLCRTRTSTCLSDNYVVTSTNRALAFMSKGRVPACPNDSVFRVACPSAPRTKQGRHAHVLVMLMTKSVIRRCPGDSLPNSSMTTDNRARLGCGLINIEPQVECLRAYAAAGDGGRLPSYPTIPRGRSKHCRVSSRLG